MGRILILFVIAFLAISSALALVSASSVTQNLTVTILPGGIFLKIISPVEGAVYGNRQVTVDLDFGTSLESFILSDNGNPLRISFGDSTSYNLTKPFDDGRHSVTIKIRTLAGTEETETINFTVDSKVPRIISLQTKQITNGTFSLSFQEENPKSLTFYYGTANDTKNQQINISQCAKEGLNTKCQIYVNSSAFDNKVINFWFNITDILYKSAKSQVKSALVDTRSPIVNSLKVSQLGIFSLKFVTITLNITESNFDSVLITKVQQPNNLTSILCSSLSKGICQRTKVFFVGDKFSLSVSDKAGNRAFAGSVVV